MACRGAKTNAFSLLNCRPTQHARERCVMPACEWFSLGMHALDSSVATWADAPKSRAYVWPPSGSGSRLGGLHVTDHMGHSWILCHSLLAICWYGTCTHKSPETKLYENQALTHSKYTLNKPTHSRTRTDSLSFLTHICTVRVPSPSSLAVGTGQRTECVTGWNQYFWSLRSKDIRGGQHAKKTLRNTELWKTRWLKQTQSNSWNVLCQLLLAQSRYTNIDAFFASCSRAHFLERIATEQRATKTTRCREHASKLQAKCAGWVAE